MPGWSPWLSFVERPSTIRPFYLHLPRIFLTESFITLDNSPLPTTLATPEPPREADFTTSLYLHTNSFWDGYIFIYKHGEKRLIHEHLLNEKRGACWMPTITLQGALRRKARSKCVGRNCAFLGKESFIAQIPLRFGGLDLLALLKIESF